MLLMMHGLTRNSADFEPLVGKLAGHYRMIVPDQRGRGPRSGIRTPHSTGRTSTRRTCWR
ncbi:alpha/beta fold hydrolase [Novosphingobium resinovorum]